MLTRTAKSWEIPQMTSPNDDSAKLAAVRGVLTAFDWEHDDRQYALEEIDRIVMDGAE
jgi:hypothetical protein